MTLLQVSGLKKHYDGARPFTLGPLNISLNAGDTVAILGANGAGKSTLFQILTGNLAPTEGTIILDSERVTVESSSLKKKFGYLPQALDLPRWATAHEVLTIASVLYELPNPAQAVAESLAFWDATSYAHLPLAACSYGMQKRVGLALAFIHQPQVLIIDEPFSGLDLFHTRSLERQLLQRQKEPGITILSTHVAPYAARFCARALIISKGHIRELDAWKGASHANREQQVEDAFFA
jgi:ABC-type multidrug transport system ATPase subunit